MVVPADAPKKGNLVVRYHGRDTGKKAVLLLAHIDVVEANPADWSPDIAAVLLPRAGRLLVRARHDGRQGRGVHQRREPDPHEARGLRARPRHHRRAHRGRGGRTAQRRGLPPRGAPRPDRRRGLRPQRGRRRDGEGRPQDLQQRAGQREEVPVLHLRGHQPGRPLVAAAEEERDLRPVAGAPRGAGLRLPGHAQRGHRGVLLALGRPGRRRDGRRDAAHRREPGRRRRRGHPGRRAELLRPAAHHLRGHHAAGRSRAERPAADGAGDGELPHPPGSRPGGGEPQAPGARRSLRRDRDAERLRHPQPALAAHRGGAGAHRAHHRRRCGRA